METLDYPRTFKFLY